MLPVVPRILLALLSLVGIAAAEPEPVPGLAAQGRLHLQLPADAPPLQDASISSGEVRDASWLDDPAARQRLTDVTFPVHWWKWRTLELTFTPAHTGTLELSLNGPWAEARPGTLFRQEILWDDFHAQGATLLNPSFEESSGPSPSGWNSPWRPYLDASDPLFRQAPPADGKTYAASWHGRPLTQTLQVTRRQPVTLRFQARAATPPGFKTPRKLPADTPAHQAARQLHRGVNFGNGWEAPKNGGWRIAYTVGDVDHVADQGFDHLRLPVAWHHEFSPPAETSAEPAPLPPSLLAEIEPILRQAQTRRLRVILNWHHFDDLTADPAAHRRHFIEGWRSIARHFRSWPDTLLFELLNEPHTALDGETLNELYADTLAAIRRIDPDRIILVNPSQWASIPALDRLRLPDDDTRLIVSVHCYDPFAFTHQGANWVQLQDLKGIRYPGPPPSPASLPDSLKSRPDLIRWIHDYNRLPAARNPSSPLAFTPLLDQAAEWSRTFGRPIHIGEFGAFRSADPASREAYYRDFRKAAEARRIPWAVWDWKAGFAYWDPEQNRPLLREALFDRP